MYSKNTITVLWDVSEVPGLGRRNVARESTLAFASWDELSGKHSLFQLAPERQQAPPGHYVICL